MTKFLRTALHSLRVIMMGIFLTMLSYPAYADDLVGNFEWKMCDSHVQLLSPYLIVGGETYALDLPIFDLTDKVVSLRSNVINLLQSGHQYRFLGSKVQNFSEACDSYNVKWKIVDFDFVD